MESKGRKPETATGTSPRRRDPDEEKRLQRRALVAYLIGDQGHHQSEIVDLLAKNYGINVSAATVAQLQSFYDNHTRGTILAPLPSLGNKIALGAWTTKDANDPTNGTAHLAKCTSFDEKAFGAFFDDFQFQGPERFPPNTLLPGHN